MAFGMWCWVWCGMDLVGWSDCVVWGGVVSCVVWRCDMV